MDYTLSNLTPMYEEGASVEDCANACNADETCYAFDFGSEEGYCYAYKQDTLAEYVGSGTEGWSCYHRIVLPGYCDYSDISTILDINIEITTLQNNVTSLEA